MNCVYNLWNISSQQCPECGQAFDPMDPSTFIVAYPRSLDGDWCMWGAVAALVAGLMSFVAGPAFGWVGIVAGDVLAILIAAAVLWKAIPGVLGRIEEVSHPYAMYVGCLFALIVILAASGWLVLISIN